MKSIAISLSPNTEVKDIFLAASLIFSPWVFMRTDYIKLLEQWFRSYFGIAYAISFNSGRSSLFAILKALDIGKNHEVIIQAFTCVVVPNVIIATGARPIYVDVDNSLTMDVQDLEHKITKKTKAIVVQHTFGMPSNMNIIKQIARKNRIPVVEDCAHIIGGVYANKKLGSLADASFFSFGRDKAFSSVFGGMAVTKNKKLGKRVREYQKKMDNPSFFWVIQQLFHPVAFMFIIPLYNVFHIGKVLLVGLQKLRLLSLPVSREERRGKYSFFDAKKLSNPLAALALFQLRRLRKFNKHREAASLIYINGLDSKLIGLPSREKLAFLRFPIMVNNRDGLINFLRSKGIYAGKWYSEIIDPEGVNLEKAYYRKGSCLDAERFAKKIVNLPTYPRLNLKDAALIRDLVNEYVRNKGSQK